MVSKGIAKTLLVASGAAAVAFAWWATAAIKSLNCDGISRNALHLMSDLAVRVEKYKETHTAYPVAFNNEQLRTYPGFEDVQGGAFDGYLRYWSDGNHYLIAFRRNRDGPSPADTFTIEVRDGRVTSWPECVWNPRLKAFTERLNRALGRRGSQSNAPLSLPGAKSAPAG